MSAISDFADEVEQHLDAIDANIVNATNGVNGVADDIAFIKSELAALQPISLDDQARLDRIKSRVTAVDNGVASTAAALKAVDDLTPPAAPKSK